jgi:hypothetical protein
MAAQRGHRGGCGRVCRVLGGAAVGRARLGDGDGRSGIMGGRAPHRRWIRVGGRGHGGLGGLPRELLRPGIPIVRRRRGRARVARAARNRVDRASAAPSSARCSRAGLADPFGHRRHVADHRADVSDAVARLSGRQRRVRSAGLPRAACGAGRPGCLRYLAGPRGPGDPFRRCHGCVCRLGRRMARLLAARVDTTGVLGDGRLRDRGRGDRMGLDRVADPDAWTLAVAGGGSGDRHDAARHRATREFRAHDRGSRRRAGRRDPPARRRSHAADRYRSVARCAPRCTRAGRCSSARRRRHHAHACGSRGWPGRTRGVGESRVHRRACGDPRETFADPVDRRGTLRPGRRPGGHCRRHPRRRTHRSQGGLTGCGSRGCVRQRVKRRAARQLFRVLGGADR